MSQFTDMTRALPRLLKIGIDPKDCKIRGIYMVTKVGQNTFTGV
jgi:hypothetical protein